MKRERFEKIVEWEYPRYFLLIYVIVLLSFIQGMILTSYMPEANFSSSFELVGVAAMILFTSLIFLIFGFIYLGYNIERKVYWRKTK